MVQHLHELPPMFVCCSVSAERHDGVPSSLFLTITDGTFLFIINVVVSINIFQAQGCSNYFRLFSSFSNVSFFNILIMVKESKCIIIKLINNGGILRDLYGCFTYILKGN